MTIRLGVVMDSITSIHYHMDATLTILWEAEARGWEIYYFEQQDLFSRDSIPYGDAKRLKVFKDPKKWFQFEGETKKMPLADLDVILMRKEPPVNEQYFYITYILDLAERLGVLVMNRPQALRDANEKLFTLNFPQCIPPTLITQSVKKLHEFWLEQNEIVCKPLNNMCGVSVFRLKADEVNADVIFETLTNNGKLQIVAQKFIPAIVHGDKRILMINGEPSSHALARIPQNNDWRGNLMVGAKGMIQPLTERDKEICAQVGPLLRERGLYFVGIDVIGDYLTEINVTSSGCLRQISDGTGVNLSAKILDVIEKNLIPHRSP